MRATLWQPAAACQWRRAGNSWPRRAIGSSNATLARPNCSRPAGAHSPARWPAGRPPNSWPVKVALHFGQLKFARPRRVGSRKIAHRIIWPKVCARANCLQCQIAPPVRWQLASGARRARATHSSRSARAAGRASEWSAGRPAGWAARRLGEGNCAPAARVGVHRPPGGLLARPPAGRTHVGLEVRACLPACLCATGATSTMSTVNTASTSNTVLPNRPAARPPAACTGS